MTTLAVMTLAAAHKLRRVLLYAACMQRHYYNAHICGSSKLSSAAEGAGGFLLAAAQRRCVCSSTPQQGCAARHQHAQTKMHNADHIFNQGGLSSGVQAFLVEQPPCQRQSGTGWHRPHAQLGGVALHILNQGCQRHRPNPKPIKINVN